MCIVILSDGIHNDVSEKCLYCTISVIWNQLTLGRMQIRPNAVVNVLLRHLATFWAGFSYFPLKVVVYSGSTIIFKFSLYYMYNTTCIWKIIIPKTQVTLKVYLLSTTMARSNAVMLTMENSSINALSPALSEDSLHWLCESRMH